MKNKIIYTFTFERLNECKKEKKDNDEIITAISINNKDNPIKLENAKNYYIDITNLYKSTIENNNIIIENILNVVYGNDNCHIILNENLKNRFKQDFATSFDEMKPIQTIYTENSNINNFDFSNINNESLEKIKCTLNEKLIGHNAFKKEFLKRLNNFPILYKLGEMKIFSLLICGNPGVGKTEFARLIHKTLYKNSKMIKINLGNYKTQGALNSLIGSPIGFVGSERGGELSNKIRDSDSKVILIDEFEKADTDIFNFFYELLEDGKFTDLTGNEYDLKGYIIVFTTNLSKDDYKDILPLPLLSRFTLKYFFDEPNYEEKLDFIDMRIKNLIFLYRKENLKPEITSEKIKSNLNYNIIKEVSDFRVINRIILNALIKSMDAKKYKQNKKNRVKSKI